MPDTKIKICGITRAEDAMVASDYGADAIGMVFYAASPRSISIEDGIKVAGAVSPFVTTVALFVNPDEDWVWEVSRQVKPHLLQFHGDEEPHFCEQFDRPYLKAIRVREDTDLGAVAERYSSAAGLICDAWVDGVYGGTGETFNWQKLVGHTSDMILAGGLTPDNVADAVDLVHPYGLDVSSGVESSPGVKDLEKVLKFIRAVRGRDVIPW